MKNIFILIASVALLFSCNNDKEVEISYQLTATVDVIDVVKNIKDIDKSDLFPNGEVPDAKVHVSFLLYDNDGNLIMQEQKKLNSFQEKMTVNKAMEEGDYTIVCTAFVVEDEDNLAFWKFEKVNTLRDFKITYPTTWITPQAVLGVTKQAISINGSENITINVKPVGALLTLNFDYLSMLKIQTIKLGIKTWNNYYAVFDSNANMMDLLNDGNVYNLEKGTSRNRIQSIYFLPVNQVNIKWVGLDIAGKTVASGVIPSTPLNAGEDKIYTINTYTGEIETITKAGGDISPEKCINTAVKRNVE